MFSSNQNVQSTFRPIFREYIAKFMNRCLQSANERNTTLLIKSDTLTRIENADDDNSSYPSSKIIGGIIFLSVSAGMYLFISRKK